MEQDDEDMCAGTSHNGHRVERLLLQSTVVILDNTKDKNGSLATDELIQILNKQKFNFPVFNEMIKTTVIFRLSLKT